MADVVAAQRGAQRDSGAVMVIAQQRLL